MSLIFFEIFSSVHFLENFISALRFCDIIVESCNRNPSICGIEKKNNTAANYYEVENEKIKFEENSIFTALLNAFSELFLKSHVRISLLSTGEQQSMASFTLSRILLSELRKSTGNGVLLQMTASYMCGGNSFRSSESDASIIVCTDAHNDSKSSNLDDNMSRPVYDIIASIISRAKSKNRDLAVSSTLLLSSVIRSSDLHTAAALCNKREGDGFPFNSAVNSVQNTPNITVSVDNTPTIIDRENPLGIYRKIGSHMVTDVRDFHRNLLIESTNQENDFNDAENGKENITESSNKNVKENNYNNTIEINNDNSDITKWEKVEFENLESRLTRICEEIFSSDKKFSIPVNSEKDKEMNNVNKIEKKDSRNIKESAEYDSVFSFKYTDVSACNITARLSSRLSSWLHFENINSSSKSNDNALDFVKNNSTDDNEQKVRINTKITATRENKNMNDKKDFETDITNHAHSVLFDFILYRLAVFPDLRYEEQVALSGIIRDTLCVLCSTLVDRSLNYDNAYERKTNTDEKLKLSINTINQTNNKERNEFSTSCQIYHHDDILIFILNVIEITSSLRKDMKTHLKSVALHGLKIKLLHDMLSTSSSSTTLPKSEIKQNVANDKKIAKNTNLNLQNDGSKRRENGASQITPQKDKEKLSIGVNDDIVILNDENCKLVSDETKQNKRILETTVILNELLRETQGMVFATNKLKFSLLTALNYSKSVIVFDENMKMDVNNNEKSEFESDDETEMDLDQNRELKDIVNDRNSDDDDFDMVTDESLNGKKPQTVNINKNKNLDTQVDFTEKDTKFSNEITRTVTSIAGKMNGIDRNEKCETDFLNDYEILEKELLNINC